MCNLRNLREIFYQTAVIFKLFNNSVALVIRLLGFRLPDALACCFFLGIRLGFVGERIFLVDSHKMLFRFKREGVFLRSLRSLKSLGLHNSALFFNLKAK